MGCRLPCRFELFDDNSINRICYFDPESQRSKLEVDHIHVLPVRELPLDNRHNLMTLFDYLPKNAVVITLEGVLEKAEQFWQEVNQRYEQLDVDAHSKKPLAALEKFLIEFDGRVLIAADTKSWSAAE